ncbi:Ubiquinol-cytochrome-c reductase complex assembly factor 1 [Strongyloides ratti]|uniref:Ubiquinol-cytochrome-c reductase complex assembly factor 1 n=1 Tax=Strongyloides ratti TaxID=34506 RepID=A0A090LSF6_STRRB|nr:Ubiquinol-cytochrome-c reductase complex assembly factor 1 [Strongyloides ratti]CEF70543.1 Ubiquinol-cytochrome-c reductase complex assembly factor 1 [Strongyloides ratti]
MITTLAARRILGLNSTRHISSTIYKNNVPVKKEGYKPLSIEEFVEKEMQKPQSKIPEKIRKAITIAKYHLFKKTPLDQETRLLLDKSAGQLYFCCANNFPFIGLQEKFGLPDTFASWYKLTLMHVWMVLMRIHLSMDYYSYERFRTTLLSVMWHDIDTRLKLVSQEINMKLNSKKDIRKMHGLYVQTLFEYDEGFLKNDVDLAGAVWRNLYVSKEIDPICLASVVMYIRSTVAYLDSLETGELLVNGISQWRQLKGRKAIE